MYTKEHDSMEPTLKMVEVVDPKVEKVQFIEHVKRWVLLDTHLKQLQEKSKQIREEKQRITSPICNYLDKHGMRSKKIGIHDGDLRVYEKKDYTPLTFGYVEERLGEIIPETSSVDFIIQYLKEHRTIKTSLDLRRNYIDTTSQTEGK